MPTTTSAPAVRSLRTAEERWRTERVGGIRWVTSFAPTMITQMSGIHSDAETVSPTWRSRSSDWAPGSATLRSSTGRSATAERPDASRAPGVWRARWTPWPAAVESPSRTSLSGGSPGVAYTRPYRPSALGGCGLPPLPTWRFAIRTSASTSPTAAALIRPIPPPPYAAPAAIRRATLALDMLVMRRRHLLVAVQPLLAPYRPSANRYVR